MNVSQHLAVMPVVLPAATAVLLLALGDSPPRRGLVRAVALLSVLLGLMLAALLVQRASTGELMVYRVGDWPAPFGITLVVDRLSALMLLLTACVAGPALWAATDASTAWDTRGRYFHALFQFQLMGLNGAFVTGDIFNLFVFFEVLLIASYVLLMHGLGRERLKVGLHYVVLNLVASALFLIGVSLIYASTGTLNFADLALRIPQVQPPNSAVMQGGALILLVVFGFKAALAPWALWLPATYAAASAPVAALFAIMTKVGVYAILRVHGVAFGTGLGGEVGASAGLAQPFILALALAGATGGVLGALAATTLPRLMAWLTVASVGTLLAAVGLYSTAAWSAALVYMAHSTFIGAALFLLADVLARQRGAVGAQLLPGPPLAQHTLLGLMLVLAAASAAGLPPLPGFAGKVMLLQAAANHPAAAWVWAVVLTVGLLTLVSLARAGSTVFWHTVPEAPEALAAFGGPAVAVRGLSRTTASAFALLALGIAMTVWAAPLQRYSQAAAVQLSDTAGYARAVLPESGGAKAVTTRPYRPYRPNRSYRPDSHPQPEAPR
jgi:multicomponent K+:H+ antiporter subunit D